MKKLLLFVVTLTLTFFAFLLLHDKGNQLTRPYLAEYLEKRFQLQHRVEIQHLKIDLNYFELTARIDEQNLINAQGNYRLLQQALDANYTIDSKSFEHKNFNFDKAIHTKGTAKGTFDKLKVQGIANTLNSTIDYRLELENTQAKNIVLTLVNADLSSLLEQTAQPVYLMGKADVRLFIPHLNAHNSVRDINITFKENRLNTALIQEKFEIAIPKKTRLSGDVVGQVLGDTVLLQGQLHTHLALLEFNNTQLDLKNKALTSLYTLFIPELAQLQFIKPHPLHGAVELTGNLISKDTSHKVTAHSKSFGGEMNITVVPDDINVLCSHLHLDKVLSALHQDVLVRGELVGNLSLKRSTTPQGTFSFVTHNAKTVDSQWHKSFEINLGKDTPFVLTTQGTFKNQHAKLESRISSELLHYDAKEMYYDLNTKKLTSHYTINLPQLSKLEPFLKRPLQGSMDVHGTMHYDTALYTQGTTKSFGGEIDFSLFKQHLESNISNVPIENLIKLLNYPTLFKAKLDGVLNYHLTKKQGTLKSQLTQAQLLPNTLTNFIQRIRGVDLTKERYNESYLNANLNYPMITLDFHAKSRQVLLEIPSGLINTATNQIDAPYNVNINQRNLSGRLNGNLSNPDLGIDTTKFIQQEVKEIIKENIDQEQLRSLGIGESEQKAIKNFLGDLFR